MTSRVYPQCLYPLVFSSAIYQYHRSSWELVSIVSLAVPWFFWESQIRTQYTVSISGTCYIRRVKPNNPNPAA